MRGRAVMPRGVPGTGMKRTAALSPEEMRQKREALQAQLRELEAQDAERYAIIGRVVAHRAEADEAFARELRGMLDREVKDRGERLCVGLTIPRRGGRGRAADASTPIDDAGETI